MAVPSTITVDLARGEITLGARRIALVCLDASTGGTPSRFRLAGDVVVRAITFGERSRLVREALADGNPRERLVCLLRVAALEGEQSTLSDAVIFALAGGGGDAPAFERCAIDASRVRGWNWGFLHDTLALVVDGAVESVGRTASSGEWNRFIFPAADTREVDELLREMATRLLARGSVSGPDQLLPEQTERAAAVAADESLSPAAPETADRAARETPPPTGRQVASPAVPWPNRPRPANPAPVATEAGGTGAPGDQRSVSASPHTRRVPQRAARRALPSPVAGAAPQPASSSATTVARASANPATASAIQRGGGVSARPATTATAARQEFMLTPAAARRPAAGAALARSPEPRSWLPVPAPTPAPASPTAAPAFRPLAARTMPPATHDAGTRETAAHVPAATRPALHDLLDEVARALAAECDLRGLDA